MAKFLVMETLPTSSQSRELKVSVSSFSNDHTAMLVGIDDDDDGLLRHL
jgi:hypothetical protein